MYSNVVTKDSRMPIENSLSSGQNDSDLGQMTSNMYKVQCLQKRKSLTYLVGPPYKETRNTLKKIGADISTIKGHVRNILWATDPDGGFFLLSVHDNL